jgi:hypothetical protein
LWADHPELLSGKVAQALLTRHVPTKGVRAVRRIPQCHLVDVIHRSYVFRPKLLQHNVTKHQTAQST